MLWAVKRSVMLGIDSTAADGDDLAVIGPPPFWLMLPPRSLG
jgi:hypothetical protein